jgi:basic membrane protein A
MSKKFFTVVSLLVIVATLLAACAPAATTEAPTTPPQPTSVPPTAVPPTAVPPTVAPTAAPTAVPPTVAPTKAAKKFCLVTDTGGINDKSFNASAWLGLTDAQTKLGATTKYLQSQQQTDYAKNVQAYIDEKCDLIVTVGFLLGGATADAAKANPKQPFAIVDYCYGKDNPLCDASAGPFDNVLGLTFATDQAAFLAGYLAAGMTKTGKVGTFAGLLIPTVTIFENGYVAGVQYYNKIHNTKVTVLGFDPKNPDKGLAAGGFNDQTKGKDLGNSLLQEGADIIMPVAGAVGLGAAAAVKANGKGLIIGVDQDWTVTNPDYTSITLTSVEKVISVAVYSAAQAVNDGTFKGGAYTGTLENNGVRLSPYHDLDSKVPAALKAEIDQLKADIIAGKVSVKPAQ